MGEKAPDTANADTSITTMNRRNFLSLAALAIAGKAAERVFPFRVYSIPKEIVAATHPLDTMFQVEASAQQRFMASLDDEKLKLYGGARGGGRKLLYEHNRLVQEYADSCATAAMREFKERLRRFQYYQNVPRLEWNGLSREWVPTAPQSSRP